MFLDKEDAIYKTNLSAGTFFGKSFKVSLSLNGQESRIADFSKMLLVLLNKNLTAIKFESINFSTVFLFKNVALLESTVRMNYKLE